MKKHLFSLILIGSAIWTGCDRTQTLRGDYNIIPAPQNIDTARGTLDLSEGIILSANFDGTDKDNLINLLTDFMPDARIGGEKANRGYIHFDMSGQRSNDEHAGGYRLNITGKGVEISSPDPEGLFYGLQTFRQLYEQFGNEIPALKIEDYPRFEYRGFMMDVSRHFRSVEFVKKQLDMLAYLKLNMFHFHLTDAAGWRIEIDKYPLLTEIAAWRPYRNYNEWKYGGRRYCRQDDPKAEGGFYTKEEIREILDYASSLYITVIPEIEMPSHSFEVLSVYPELSCSGRPYTDEDFCVGNEDTFTFLEDVLTEVMELFPSEYIHIGGDEAPKTAWHTCPKCQARMRDEGMESVDQLQSYMIHRIEEFLNAHGRQIIGWDEIMEGGLAPNATVMSWRGTQGGLDAINAGHKAIMAPDSYAYLDFYQDAPTTQPEAMASFTPIEKVYSFEPLPDDIDPGTAKLLRGVQANLWAEYIPTDDHYEYMMYPRLFAMAEVAWTMPEHKDYDDFRRRALAGVVTLREKGYNPFNLATEIGPRPESLEPVQNGALGAPVIYNMDINPNYAANGEKTMVDGMRGGWSYQDGRWQGVRESDFDVIIDMGSPREINSVTAQFYQMFAADIWLPKEVTISVSEDNENWTELQTIPTPIPIEERRTIITNFGWTGEAQARYIRYHALDHGVPGGWIFVDEIIVN